MPSHLSASLSILHKGDRLAKGHPGIQYLRRKLDASVPKSSAGIFHPEGGGPRRKALVEFSSRITNLKSASNECLAK